MEFTDDKKYLIVSESYRVIVFLVSPDDAKSEWSTIYPLVYNLSEDITCVKPDLGFKMPCSDNMNSGPKSRFFYAVTFRGTIYKFVISENPKFLRTDFGYLPKRIIKIGDVKNPLFEKLDPCDDTTEILLMYPSHALGKLAHQSDMKVDVNKMVQSKDKKNSALPEMMQIVSEGVNNLPSIAKKSISQRIIEQNEKKKVEQREEVFGQTFRLFETNSNDCFILLFCQGSISIYSHDLKYLDKIIDRRTIINKERQGNLEYQSFSMYDKKYYSAIDRPPKWAKNFVCMSQESKCIALNCLNPGQSQMNVISLDAFFSMEDCWENGSSYCHPNGIKYFNYYKKKNYLTSFILQTLRGELFEHVNSVKEAKKMFSPGPAPEVCFDCQSKRAS
jgi:hypothetical protein